MWDRSFNHVFWRPISLVRIAHLLSNLEMSGHQLATITNRLAHSSETAREKMELKFKPQNTNHTQLARTQTQPPRTQKTQKPSSLAFIHVNDPKQAKDKETLKKVRRHVMKDIGRSRRSGETHDVTTAKPSPQSRQTPTYWGDVQVCVNVKRLLWAMEMVSGPLLSIAVVDPDIRDQQKITKRLDDPPSMRDVELYTQSLGTVRKSILAETRVDRNRVMGTVICLSVFDMRVGNLSSWAMHMAGLRMILDLTGGVEAMDPTSPLRKALFLADVLGALKQDIMPKFPPLDIQSEPRTAISPYTERLIQSLERLSLADQTPTVVIRKGLSYVSRVAMVLNKHWADNPTDSGWNLVAEEHMGTATQVWALAELTSGDVGYLIPRRDVPFQYLMSLIDDEFWDGKLELKLWLMVNQLCVEASISRIWYLGQIADTISRAHLCSWKDLMSCLREVVWVEGLAPQEMAQLQLYIDNL
ncbi:unnamed protein product [Fusarium langsethiae]|nr:unnamed protein product [Fusarium langsethiae]